MFLTNQNTRFATRDSSHPIKYKPPPLQKKLACDLAGRRHVIQIKGSDCCQIKFKFSCQKLSQKSLAYQLTENVTKWLIDPDIHVHDICKFGSFHIQRTMRLRCENRSVAKDIPLYSENHTQHTTVPTMCQLFLMLKPVDTLVTTVTQKIQEVPLSDCSHL
jgi:hypothetical protein